MALTYVNAVAGVASPVIVAQRFSQEARVFKHRWSPPMVRNLRPWPTLGIPFSVADAIAPVPWQAILAATEKNTSEAIVMASHRRRDVSAALLGSETQTVLTCTNVPVIVAR